MWAALLPTVASAGVLFELDFNHDGVLPSAQGLNFYGSGPAVEADVFQVSGGLLHIDTTQYSNDVMAFYEIIPGFDHSLDTVLEFRAQTLSSHPGYGLDLAFYDADAFGRTVLRSTFLTLSTGPSISFSPGFHTFNLTTTAATNSFVFSIDGTVVRTGTLPNGFSNPPNPPIVYFGDGSPTGGNFRAEIDYIRYSNNAAVNAVPEPSSLALLASGILGFMGYHRLRRSKVNSLFA